MTVGHLDSATTLVGTSGRQNTMRIGIREQLALLVLLTSMVALAVVSIATVSNLPSGKVLQAGLIYIF